jgi:hypothetical protein
MQYSLCAEALRIVCPSRSRKARVTGILEALFSLTPRIGRNPGGMEFLLRDLPAGEVCGELVYDAPGLSAIRTDRGYHLRSGGSFLAVDPRSGKAAGSLSEAFLAAPLEDQRGLFLFAFLLLLSGRGLYGLHAGGALWNGCGFLLAGRSGSGKTTLICALARSGWQYLSDDSVLLKRGSSGVESLAFGRPFHCGPATVRHFPELAGGGPKPVSGKRLVDVGSVYPGRFRSELRPRIVLFPEITAAPFSRVVPLSCTETLVRLLGEGAGVVHDRNSMAGQMAMLGDLARSARGFRLLHGRDVHADPARVAALLQELAKSESEGDYTDGLYSAA